MWITSLKLNRSDKYDIHKYVYSFFTEEVEKIGRHFCYKVMGDGVLVYSFSKIDETSEEICFEKGQKIKGSIYCSVSQGTYRDENGKRHRMTRRTSIDDAFSWFERRLSDSVKVNSLSGKLLAPEAIIKSCGRKMVFNRWVLSYDITVCQPKTFEDTVIKGIGQGSGFGLGLMGVNDL